MDLNADFNQRASAHTSTMDWVTSPMPGVERKMLDRIGDEVARATTVVRYAPGSVFSPHIHTGGEEFLVLDGVFQDEHGDFPRGSYVRNPPESRHTPGSADGCTILVKLWQFDLNDRVDTKLHTHQLIYNPVRNHSDRSTAELHHDAREHVCMQQWQPGTQVLESFASGVELFVLGGSFTEQNETFTAGSWLRLPCASALRTEVGSDGAHVWLKSGHLRSEFLQPPAK